MTDMLTFRLTKETARDRLRAYIFDTRNMLPSQPDFLKVCARLQPSQVATVIDEAHRHHLPVIDHHQRTSWVQGLELGIDYPAHAALDRDDIGAVEAGRRAYLVLLSADPRISISSTRSIIWVMQGGKFFTTH